MEEKWVTLAIRTYERAQMIKAVLEQNGIDTVIHNLNLDKPEVAVGVRVRIKEYDLPQALNIVEEMEKAWEQEANASKPYKGRTVLIPVELDDRINAVCRYGFHFAKKMDARVVFLHAYVVPPYTIVSATSNPDINTYSLIDAETMKRMLRSQKADVDNLTNLVRKWIERGILPNVEFSFELKGGVPEDEILSYSKRESPALVVMGTRSKHYRDDSLLGSVTAEVLEACREPVMAIAAETETEPDSIKRIAFLTNFDQKDLIAIDTAISLLNTEGMEIVFIHASEKMESWDEVMLAGIRQYFANHYPDIKTEYAFIKKDGNLKEIQAFLANAKIDIVALNSKKRGLFARFFNQGIATKLLFNVETPLMVMHI